MDLDVLNLDKMKALADSFGIVYHPATGEKKMRIKLDEYVKENPDCLKDEVEDEAKEELIVEEDLEIKDEVELELGPEEGHKEPELVIEPKKVTLKKTGLIKIKSEYRGEISSSVGMVDFGEDGVVEVTEEQAKLFLSLKGYSEC